MSLRVELSWLKGGREEEERTTPRWEERIPYRYALMTPSLLTVGRDADARGHDHSAERVGPEKMRKQRSRTSREKEECTKVCIPATLVRLQQLPPRIYMLRTQPPYHRSSLHLPSMPLAYAPQRSDRCARGDSGACGADSMTWSECVSRLW